MNGRVKRGSGVGWRRPHKLYEEIARELAHEIIEGRYEAGELLPTEHELVEVYGASRNIVREAVKLLKARGLVEVMHGRGTEVLPTGRWQTIDQLVRLVRDDPKVPEDLLELRRIIEVEIAALAAEHATEGQIRELQATIDAMRGASGDLGECVEQDVRFHRLLAEASGNRLLPMVLEPAESIMRAGREATVKNPGAIQRSIDAHSEILRRVREREPGAARRAMLDHLCQVKEEMRQLNQR